MPGLKELSNFRDELGNLGHEREVTAARGEIYEELPFPAEPAAAMSDLNVDDLLAGIGNDTGEGVGETFSDTAVPPDPADFPETFENSEVTDSTDGMPDFGSFDDILSSLPIEEEASDARNDDSAPLESFEEAESFEAGETSAAPEPEDPFGIPENLLSGFADEIEQGRAEDSGFSLPDFDMEMPEIPDTPALGEIPMPDFNFDGDSAMDTGEASEAEEITDLDEMPEAVEADEAAEAVDEFEEMDFTPDFEMDKPSSANKPKTKVVEESFPGFEDFDAAEMESPSFKPADDDFSDFSVPDDLDIGSPEKADASGTIPDLDGFDGFSLDTDFLKTSIDSSVSTTDDFHIPGFSDFTSSTARPALSDFPQDTVISKKGGKKEVPLKISDEDFLRFLEVLASYPLNLRIAVEEYLSGTAGTEIQKMSFVQEVLSHASVRKIARLLETALDRSIPIPKDYEKKTVADYEKEKASLRYVFMNRILPGMVLFTIVAVLAACVSFLSYQFIYRPLAAESLYKRGYTAIEEGRYSQSISLFEEAVRLWEKKQWYFKYARAFREKKQYISAEMMYERLLDRYDNDKEAGLEYAQMLRGDLRNFEAAEKILKRRLLDYYVNDKDGLMLLGDTYLDWAEEDPSKFEEARRTYAMLIELYGTQDPFLSRMMRYFIRIDNLAEVLPLKDHFMEKKAKIGAEDLVELGGYLLEKRYNPQPGESEFMRSKIEDVRTLLDRALKADDTSPEAHYNMGRFFIWNYKNEPAIMALEESLRNFEQVSTMSPKRVLTRIDAYRLLGNLYGENKEYLKARDFYTRGIVFYEEQRQNRTVKQDPRVGKLYASYADIDYFITGDLDSAFLNYTKATRELADTPSIRYRLGYIGYQKQDFEAALREFTLTHAEMPGDRNLLYSYGSTLYRRGDFYASQGYLERLMGMLDAERIRKGIVFPQVRIDHGAFVQQYMHAANNLGVTLNKLANRTGDSKKNARAFALLSESTRAWDALTRNPETLVRAQGTNLAYLNIQNMTHPRPDFQPDIYADIPNILEGEKALQQRDDQ